MVLKYFLPERDFSFKQLDKMSHKQPGKGTWWPPMLIELQNLGLAVKCLEAFDYERFYQQGEPYVRSAYPSEVADYYLKRSNLNEIKPLIPDFLRQVSPQPRTATMTDLNRLLDDGWLVGVDLNARILNDQPGFSSHMVVIFSRANDNYWLHDPGLPPKSNRQISRQKFARSWFWAGRQTAGLVPLKDLKIDFCLQKVRCFIVIIVQISTLWQT